KSLYVGQAVRGWGRPSEGLQRIAWQGGVPFTIDPIAITAAGFRLTFTAPINDAAKAVAGFAIRSNTYQPKWTYGAAAENLREEPIRAIKVVNDRTVELTLENPLLARHVYRVLLAETVQSSTAESPGFREFYYTANR